MQRRSLTMLSDYRNALAAWVKHKGLEGGGGSWVSSERRYSLVEEPKPECFGITDGYLLNLAKQIRERVLAAEECRLASLPKPTTTNRT